MIVKTATKKNKKTFNKTTNHPLQTWEWGEFRKAWGNEVVRFDFGQLTLHKIPGTKFKIGNLLKGPKPTERMIKELKKLGKKENLIFIKLEPNVAFAPGIKNNELRIKEKLINLLQNNNCVPGKTLFTPTSFWIDLTKTEDRLMKGFSSKTRYNIRLAQRKGVKVVEDNSKAAFEKYIELTRETVERQGFYAHNERYHRLLWKYLNQIPKTKNRKPIAHLLTAIYQNKIITCWIVLVWKDFLYYPYGASSDEHKNVMANNLMMWEAICFGKNLGLKTFDLWGREPGKGFTKFKEGYNPQVVEFLGTWDLVISPLYYLYRLAEAVRWIFLRTRTKLGITRPRF